MSSWILYAILAQAVHSLDDACLQGFQANGAATKYVMTDAAKTSDALCLDGTPGAYYHQPGSGSGVNKWYIHHQGGGWCESLDDCLSRSTTDLGSSKAYPATADLGGGYFATDQASNPLMYNWNHVFMRYCDGASFSGNNATVQVHKGAALHWRGMHIREAISADLFANRGLSEASDLVVSGCSAGGLATFLHTDQWCDALHATNPASKCVGLPDSGFFLDFQDPSVSCSPDSALVEPLLGRTVDGDYHCGLKWTFSIQNATAGINQDCVAAHASTADVWKCMFAEHSSDFIRSPMFAMQSQYDAWQTGNVQGTTSTQIMGDNITSRIRTDLMAHNNESGAFLDSCHHHCGSWNSIRIDGDLVSVAIQKWYLGIGVAGSKKLWNQNKPYPCTACCSP